MATTTRPHNRSPHRPSKVLSLLSTREHVGVGRCGLSARAALAQSVRVTTNELSHVSAWNPSRLQNMILAVGPGTPASVVGNDAPSESFSQSSDELSSAHDSSNSEPEGDGVEGGESELTGERSERRRRWMRLVLQEASSENDNEALFPDGVDMETEEGNDDEQKDDSIATSSTAGRRRRLSSNSSAMSHAADQNDGASADDQSEDEHKDDVSASVRSSTGQTLWRGLGTEPKTRPAYPSMRHGGCINTAAWVDCNWRLSLAHASDDIGSPTRDFIFSSSFSSNHSATSETEAIADILGRERGSGSNRGGGSPSDAFVVSAVPSTECPTQLLTSGDDRLVRFWDVSGAMGSTSPMPGGMGTINPFSSPTFKSMPPSVVREWREKHNQGQPLSGMVCPIATLRTGHLGNVFHATPVPSQPGKVATCAADGYLRLADVEMQSTSSPSSTPPTVVISPEYDEDGDSQLPAGLLRLRPGMCFSHHFLDANTGLLCSERGLRRFDLRLSPRSQQARSILGGPYRTCKACAIWSPFQSGIRFDDGEDVESAYVFAGGASGDIALYDLRMTDGTSSRIVQHYRPRALGPNASVSVSGLDISRDKRELLVSYENDQIYTFPIFPEASSPAGPTVEELSSYCSSSDGEEKDDKLLTELASYGGHLNRFTFLKMAKYAGPNDEYICTGSDSGHAWIYERKTGAVVSLLSADHSTCNGVVPHPSLPFFVTYGIDSTAKMWRATIPVESNVHDSDLGRFEFAKGLPYERSPIVRQWSSIQNRISAVGDLEDESLSFFPDEVPTRDSDDFDESIFGGLASVLFRSPRFGVHTPGGPFVGNDLANLPRVLKQNYYACARAVGIGDDEPVRSGLEGLKRRISLIRLRHQADQLGLSWDCLIPWIMCPKDHLDESVQSREIQDDVDIDEVKVSATRYGHPADLVPNHPSDWIPYDVEMTSVPKPCGMQFNRDDFDSFCCERYCDKLVSVVHREPCHPDEKMEKCYDNYSTCGAQDDQESPTGDQGEIDAASIVESKGDHTNGSAPMEDEDDAPQNKAANEEDADADCNLTTKRAWDILYQTVILLKEGGNAALQAGASNVAARRYDKAIQYCAVAFMTFPVGEVCFLAPHQVALMRNGGNEVRWTPLLKTLVTIRLNLSMAMLKSEISNPSAAADQANVALAELKPFSTSRGRVLTGKKQEKARFDEPDDTYKDAKTLQAKAYFRLGSAQCALGDFASAIHSFEQSIKGTKDAIPGGKPEPIVVRRLAEAKRENQKKKKRQRKKFKFMFSGEGENGKKTSGTSSSKEDEENEEG